MKLKTSTHKVARVDMKHDADLVKQVGEHIEKMRPRYANRTHFTAIAWRAAMLSDSLGTGRKRK